MLLVQRFQKGASAAEKAVACYDWV